MGKRVQLFAAMVALSVVNCGRTMGDPPSGPPAAAASPYHTQAQEIFDALGSDNPDVSKDASKKDIVLIIGKELANSDRAVQAQGILDIRTYESLRGPDWEAGERANWYCHASDLWSQSLLKLKQYDLIEEMVTEGLSALQYNTDGIDKLQRFHVQALLAAGKGEEALSAAKSYYNVCRLVNTAKASDLIIQALLNSRAKTDKTIIHRFKMQQIAGSQPPPAPGAAPASQPSPDLGENVLKSIKIDATPYEATLKALSEAPKNFNNLQGQGNLLLLADRPAEAKALLEVSVDLATGDRELSIAVESVARAIRAADGTVGGANAYIMSLRQGQK